MTRLFLALAALFALPAPSIAQDGDWSIVIHGGAGTILRENMTPEKEAEISAALNAALDAGEEVLAAGGSSLDAVTAAIMILEDDPNFNAGKGAVFTWEGTNSLDASIMRGDTLEAGAVAGLSTTKNPILAARAVMEDSPHVLLSGAGADEFASERGIAQVDPIYFFTEGRFQALQRFKARAEGQTSEADLPVDYKFGTVGAVAMDQDGVIAAATSTGGMTGKRWGRIGDSPIIGAGTYANEDCGVSATGTGEKFIRLAVAYRICDRYRRVPTTLLRMSSDSGQDGQIAAEWAAWKKLEINKIANDAIDDVGDLGGSGGVIALWRDGTPVYAFDTPGMYRGHARSSGERYIGIYGDDEE
ncbi:isoaspartyl peptidase/L-asparaginase family protein [Sphingomicrobium sediminis]|uniref:Isoaspartyl peptidase/L-asparaginase n=1 Tax=Sphingomicrobium sediminis TaxID=2950949 RepID=A0A9X2EHK7_9SPHN|nr:isoaspartyl peptidase/L-asparaginase [Sphingomicrobium sediminis]MCM8558178.1 isoaspartyl peptidase/L-asparaginase [Sphingomicrobium sediminis]